MKDFDWRIFAAIVLLHILLYVVFVGDEWVAESIQREQVMNQSMFGRDLAGHAMERGKGWFTSALVETQIIENSFTLFVPTEEQKANSVGISELGTPWFSWFEDRLRLFWTLTYQSFLRLSTALLWFPYAFFLMVPFIVDGVVQRRVKQTNFDYTSPWVYSLSLRLIVVLGIVFFLMIFAPFPMPPQVAPLFLIVASLSLGLITSNLLKRV